MREKILAFLHSLILYDYILFGAIFSLLLIFLILAIIKRESLISSILYIFFAFFILLAGPFIGYKTLHYFLYKNSIELVSEKKLKFMKAIVVRAKLHNESNFDFKECKITANVHKAHSNSVKNFLYSFRIIKKMTIITKDIKSGNSKNIKIIIEPFKYKKRYQISLKADCR